MPRDDHEPRDATTANGDAYERVRRRKTLYRLLAENIVRQLRQDGHNGHELLGFASAVMQAITDHGWDDKPERPATRPPHVPLDCERDAEGRPILHGPHILLRPPDRTDRPALERWTRDPLVQASLIPPVLQDVIANLSGRAGEKNRLDLIVCDRTTRAAIGLVSLHAIDPTVGQAELGKVIGDPAFRGKGAAQEAARIIVTYGFETLGLNRIYLRTRGGNLKNIRLNERMGFRFEGVLQEAALSETQLTDVVLMGVLRREFLPPPAH